MTSPNYTPYTCTNTLLDVTCAIEFKRGKQYLARTVTSLFGACSLEVFNESNKIVTVEYPLAPLSFERVELCQAN